MSGGGRKGKGRVLLELVEDLQPTKDVEDKREQALFLVVGNVDIGVVDVVAEEGGAGEVENEGDDELADGLADDHLAHAGIDERGCLLVGLAVQNGWRGRVGREGQRGEGIHDQVYPEQLNGVEHRFLFVAGNGGHKGEDDGGDVDGELEL